MNSDSKNSVVDTSIKQMGEISIIRNKTVGKNDAASFIWTQVIILSNNTIWLPSCNIISQIPKYFTLIYSQKAKGKIWLI